MYEHMTVAPQHVAYDFACDLSSYVHNRDGRFFQDTKFWHDVSMHVNIFIGVVCGWVRGCVCASRRASCHSLILIIIVIFRYSMRTAIHVGNQ